MTLPFSFPASDDAFPALDRPLVLATDLDGTFLGGSDAERAGLYQWLQAMRARQPSDLTLIFVTGRDLPFIRSLVAAGVVPRPDYVIGDVGTTIAGGPDIAPLSALEADIAARWTGGAASAEQARDALRALLAEEPGLREQDTPFRYRLSYWYEPELLSPATLPKIQAAGYDGLLSADTFLDVLPRGVSKGPTLRQLITHLRLPPQDVLVAGDTLNDLSLFATGLRGVAVGNSEPALLEALQALEREQALDEPAQAHEIQSRRIYRSPRPGAAGILDAVHHHGFITRGFFAPAR
ncbi:HAD family hydrolase [Leptospira sp. 96542]|nr:HAD family hydrolase [Leptospira sp. 96542]